LAAAKDKFEKVEKTAFTNPTFFVFKICIPLNAMCWENFGRFTEGNSRQSQNKAIKTAKNIDLGIHNLRLQPKPLT